MARYKVLCKRHQIKSALSKVAFERSLTKKLPLELRLALINESVDVDTVSLKDLISTVKLLDHRKGEKMKVQGPPHRMVAAIDPDRVAETQKD